MHSVAFGTVSLVSAEDKLYNRYEMLNISNLNQINKAITSVIIFANLQCI